MFDKPNFVVAGPVQQGKPFAVEAFLVNRSNKIKTYTVIVPCRQRGTRRQPAKLANTYFFECSYVLSI